MEDKTAEIPSLKNFSSQGKKTSSQKRKTQAQTDRRSKSDSRQSVQRKPSSESAHNRRDLGAQRSKSTQSRERQQGERAGSRRAAAPAPRTYARQRQEISETIARTQVVDTKRAYPQSKPSERYSNEFSSVPLKKQSTPESRRSSSHSTSHSSDGRSARRPESDSREERRRSSGGKPPSGRRPSGGKSAPQKKKPLSPRARKFRSFVINGALCLVVLIVGVILSLTVWFKTETITVNGNGNIPKNEIIKASGLNMGENIFTSPKARAEDKLEKAFPYIQKAEVSTVFPNGINIDITLATPSCVVEGLGGYYIVSGEGKVLEVAATTDEIQAPVVEGVNVGGKVAGDFVEFGTSVVGEALREMFAAFKELGCTEVTAINVITEEESVEIRYVHDNRIVVYLGIPEHITYKVQTAHTIIKEKIDTGGTMIAGDLDVSMCHDSMKSYFNQYTLLAPNSAHATEPETTTSPKTESPTEVYYY